MGQSGQKLMCCNSDAENDPPAPIPVVTPVKKDETIETKMAPKEAVATPGDKRDGIAEKAEKVLISDEQTLRETLWTACEEGDLATIQRVSDMGINLSTGANHEGSTAAHIATETGNLELVKWLTEHANELDETNGSTENTGSITGRTSSVAAMIESRDQFQYTVFFVACENGELEIAMHLLEHGSDLESIDSYGRTALMAAVAAEQDEIVAWLLKQGAKTDTTDQNGYTAFWSACALQNLEAMKLIRAANGTCNLTSAGGKGEVAYSTWEEENGEITSWLLGEGIEP